jgi:branched-chain amino acid transport system permease protein
MYLLELIVVTGVVSAGFYAILALSLQIVHATTGVLNFAVGQFAVIGLFSTWAWDASWHQNGWLGIVFAVVVGAAAGVVQYYVCMRTTERYAILYSSLATFAFGAFIEGLALVIFGDGLHVVNPILTGRAVQIGNTGVPRDALLTVLGSILVMVMMWFLLSRTRYGYAMRGTAASPVGALVVGVDPRSVARLSFILSGAMASLAGALLSSQVGAEFDFGTTYVVIAFISALVGGMSSPVACVLGAITVGLISSAVAATVGSEYSPIWLLGAVLIVMLVRPTGLFVIGRRRGRKTRQAVVT